MIQAILALLLPALKELAERHADDLIREGVNLLERLVSGQATDADAIAWLKRFAREGANLETPQ